MAADAPGSGMVAAPPMAEHPAAATSTSIVIDDFDFGPMTLKVRPGSTVVWTNRDPDPHTVVSADEPKLFRSPPLDTDESFSFTFEKPGTYRYFCSIHPKMLGMIIVE